LPGTQITNYASIYFDSNPAVITDTAYNQIYNCDWMFFPDSIQYHHCINDVIEVVSSPLSPDQYAWYYDTALVSQTNTLTANLSTAGGHVITLIRQNSFCIDSVTYPILVNHFDTIDLQESGVVDICFGGETYLHGESNAGGYWEGASGANLGTGDSLAVGEVGWVYLHSTSACKSSDSVYINELAPSSYAEILEGDTLQFCQYEFRYLHSADSLNNTWHRYSQYIGSDDSMIIENTGWYYLQVSLAGNCLSGRDSIYVNEELLPPTPQISWDGTTLSSSSLYNNQWYLNGQILVNDTSQFFVPGGPGIYQLAVISAIGCVSAFDEINLSDLAISETSINSISLFPSPTSGLFNLSFDHPVAAVTISIVDVAGKTVYSSAFVNSNLITVDASALSSGLYFVRIIDESQSATIPLVVNE
jgi:hypothetical protein